MVTQVHRISSKKKMNVVKQILIYSVSVSSADGVEFNCKSSGTNQKQEIIQIASLRGFQKWTVTQVHCNSSKSIMTVVKQILNYSRSVSNADGVEFNCKSSGSKPECKIIQIASPRGFQKLMVTQVHCNSSKSK